MLICSDGVTVGSLSGGCLEEEVVASARGVIRTGAPALMNFDTRLRFGCNGSIDIFIERASQEFFDELAERFEQRHSCTAVTHFHGDPARLGSSLTSHDVCASADVFVQRIEPPIRLIIFGDGPDSAPLSAFAEILGWSVTGADAMADLPETVDHRTAAIVKSHNYGRDFAALRHLLALDLRYVGLMGPRKRRDQLMHALLDDGVQIDAELFAPAGLDLNAETPEEIALAIISEIQATLADGSGESLRDRKAPIHGWNIAPAVAKAKPAAEWELSAR